jgi:hypothetical protein
MNPSQRFYDAATGEMCFGVALESLRNGKRVRRKAWEHGWFISYVMLEIAPMTNLTSKDIIAKDWVELYDDPTVGQTLP